MTQTCMPTSQEMPMCERKDVLDRLQQMVNDLEKTQNTVRQVPRLLIRSDVCECKKKNPGHSCENIRKERAAGKMPPQSFELPSELNTEVKRNVQVPQTQCSGGTCPLLVKKEMEGMDLADCSQGVKQVEETEKKTEKETEPSKSCRKKKELPQMCLEETPIPEERKVEPHPIIPIPKPSTSYELRAGKLIVGCTCLKRNGMQHDCDRTMCQGRRDCLKFPAPVCQPSGLAPIIVKPSPVIRPEDPDCLPVREKAQSKRKMEQRKILLNYARSQFQQNPPIPVKGQVPCKYHKKGLYYIRPNQKSIKLQTEELVK